MKHKCIGLLDFNDVRHSLEVLLNGYYGSFNFNEEFFNEAFANFESMEEFEKSISKIHERSTDQKENGVFYTPVDVCDYIVYNSVHSLYCKSKNDLLDCNSLFKWFIDKNVALDFVFNKTVFDPTSGTGEFLVSVLKLKFKLLKSVRETITVDDVIKVLSTISGNDIDSDANNISKIRLFIQSALFLKRCDDSIAHAIKDSFTTFDFLTIKKEDLNSFDLIIGNPPYVERTRVSKYGNIYADVIENASHFINENGVMGFIIPLSYVATPRMNGIRNAIERTFSKQLIANYSDRPASLFTRVHQKLTILIATNNSEQKGIYVSNYKYFYRETRQSIFKPKELVKLTRDYGFYPKVGSEIELTIFDKVYGGEPFNFDNLKQKEGLPVYLNMRGFFWNKAFTFNPGSSEYKEFRFSPEIRNYILCLMNSSLFWFYWVVMSDCWHITGRELSSFNVKAGKEIDYKQFDCLAKELEEKLEETKVYIGSVQTEYAYKHKCCKNIIDKIDDALAAIYKLNKQELIKVKNYALKYRVGKDNE